MRQPARAVQDLIDEYLARGGTINQCATVDARDQLRPLWWRHSHRPPPSFQPQTVTEMLANRPKGPRDPISSWRKATGGGDCATWGILPPIDVATTINRWPSTRPISYVVPASDWRPENMELPAQLTSGEHEKVVLVRDSETGFSKIKQDVNSVYNDYTSPLDHLFRDAKAVVFLKPDEQARLVEIVRICRDNSERRDEYLQAKGELIKAYTPKILRWVINLCKQWPNIRIDDVYSYICWRLLETRMDYYNPNRGGLATYFSQVVPSLFLDYLRTIKTGEAEPISISANVDCGEDEDRSTELGDLLTEEEVRGYDENTVAQAAPEILTPQEYQVFVGIAFDGKSRDDIALEMGVSPSISLN